MSRRIYLAGPFFNAEETKVMERLEDECARFIATNRISYFSPRRDGGNDSRQGDVKKHAHAIFEANARAIDGCQEMLAVLDRQFNPGTGVYLCREDERYELKHPLKGPLQQPDLGTVWEMGYAYAKRIPVIGFTLRDREAVGPLNLMLTQSVSAIVYGWTELLGYLSCDNIIEVIRKYHDTNRWQGVEE